MNRRLLQALAMSAALLGACGDSVNDRCDGAPFACPAEWSTGHLRTTASSFTVDTDTATDPTSGLMWQRKFPAEMQRWAVARDYCDNLTLGGHDDWRLPNRLELLNLVDYPASPASSLPTDTYQATTSVTSAKPMIDPSAFPDTPPTMFWTASNFVEDESLHSSAWPGDDVAWTVDFRSGLVSQQQVGLLLPRTRCVRTEHSAVAGSGGHYVTSANTVKEPATGLVWERQIFMATYEDAVAHCASLTLDGSGGFRLPHVKEAMSIVSAVSADRPYLDPAAFQLPSAYFYAYLWTSTPWTIANEKQIETNGEKRFAIDITARGRLATETTRTLDGESRGNATLCVREQP